MSRIQDFVGGTKRISLEGESDITLLLNAKEVMESLRETNTVSLEVVEQLHSDLGVPIVDDISTEGIISGIAKIKQGISNWFKEVGRVNRKERAKKALNSMYDTDLLKKIRDVDKDRVFNVKVNDPTLFDVGMNEELRQWITNKSKVNLAKEIAKVGGDLIELTDGAADPKEVFVLLQTFISKLTKAHEAKRSSDTVVVKAPSHIEVTVKYLATPAFPLNNVITFPLLTRVTGLSDDYIASLSELERVVNEIYPKTEYASGKKRKQTTVEITVGQLLNILDANEEADENYISSIGDVESEYGSILDTLEVKYKESDNRAYPLIAAILESLFQLYDVGAWNPYSDIYSAVYSGLAKTAKQILHIVEVDEVD